ncbi:MAG: hypothetical protein QOK02_2144 [Mycobacterium sp.]|jgi:hypothetical protein|nr:hypothetical protein [Mycobacterium sp.]
MPNHQPFAFMAQMRNVQTARERRGAAKGSVAAKRRIGYAAVAAGTPPNATNPFRISHADLGDFVTVTY